MTRDGYILDDPADAPKRRPVMLRLLPLCAIGLCSLLIVVMLLADTGVHRRIDQTAGRISREIGTLLPVPATEAPTAVIIHPPPPVETAPAGAAGN